MAWLLKPVIDAVNQSTTLLVSTIAAVGKNVIATIKASDAKRDEQYSTIQAALKFGADNDLQIFVALVKLKATLDDLIKRLEPPAPEPADHLEIVFGEPIDKGA